MYKKWGMLLGGSLCLVGVLLWMQTEGIQTDHFKHKVANVTEDMEEDEDFPEVEKKEKEIPPAIASQKKKEKQFDTLFKEPAEKPYLDEMLEHQNVAKLDEKADKIIREMDTYIEKNNLVLKEQTLNEEENERQSRYQEKLEKLNEKLKEFIDVQ